MTFKSWIQAPFGSHAGSAPTVGSRPPEPRSSTLPTDGRHSFAGAVAGACRGPSSDARGIYAVESVNRLIRVVEAFNRVLLASCRWGVVLLVATITVIVALGVFFRFVLNNSLPWTEEVAKFVMVWLAFIGAPVVLKEGGHIAIDVVPARLPSPLGPIVMMLIQLIVMVVLGVLVFQGWALAWNALPQIATTVDVSLFYIFLAVPIGSALMLVVSLELLLRQVAAMGASGAPPVEPASGAGWR